MFGLALSKPVLTILIPTLGRKTLIFPLTILRNWYFSLDQTRQDKIEFLIFHNDKGAISSPLSEEVLFLLSELRFRAIKSEDFFDGAELSLKFGLENVKTKYCLPVSDDSLLIQSGLDAVLDYAAEGHFSWIHFNSLSTTWNNPNDYLPNLNLNSNFVETTARELLLKIGLNYSICNISRSLIDVSAIDFALWNELVRMKFDNWSFAFILIKSMHSQKVAITKQPLQQYWHHGYNTNPISWKEQWLNHAQRREMPGLTDFTTQMSKMLEILLSLGIVSYQDLEFAIVSERDIVRPLACELIWHSINQVIFAVEDKRFLPQDEEWSRHCNFLKRAFPLYSEVISKFDVSRIIMRDFSSDYLSELRNLMLLTEGEDKFKMHYVLGSSVSNFVYHPMGILENLTLNNINDVFKFYDLVSIPEKLIFHEDSRRLDKLRNSEFRNQYQITLSSPKIQLSLFDYELISYLKIVWRKIPRFLKKPLLILVNKLVK